MYLEQVATQTIVVDLSIPKEFELQTPDERCPINSIEFGPFFPGSSYDGLLSAGWKKARA